MSMYENFTFGRFLNLCSKAIKYVVDTITGKTLPGKFFHWSARTIWNGAQNVPTGCGQYPVRNFEGWRQTRSGCLGWLINPRVVAERAMVARDRSINDSRISAVLIDSLRQPVGSAARLSHQTEAERIIREVIGETRPEDLDTADIMIDIIENCAESLAARAIALLNLKRLSRNSNFSDQSDAQDWLSQNSNRHWVEAIGLDPDRYIR